MNAEDTDISPLLASLGMVEDAVLITDAQLDLPGPFITYVNSAFEQLTGYSASAIVGQTPRVLQGPETDRNTMRSLREALDKGEDFTGETINYRKDGVPFHMRWTIRPFVSASGDVTHFIAIQRDVTRVRELDRQLQQMKALNELQRAMGTTGLDLSQLRARVADVVLQATPAEGAAVEEIDGDEMVYTAVSGTAADVLGFRLDIVTSLSGFCALNEEPILCRDVRTDSRVNTVAAEKVGFRSGVLVPLLGERRCFGVIKVYSSQPSAFDETHEELLTLTSSVLSSSLADAHSFENERQRRKQIIDKLPMLIAYIDDQLIYREANATHTAWTERSLAEIIGRPLKDIVTETTYERNLPYIEQALSGKHVEVETIIMSPDGTTRPVAADFVPHPDSRGNIQGVYVLVRDISDRKYAEEDYLTGLYNRRTFEKRFESLFDKLVRYQRPLSLVFIDLDHFKSINDRFGHPVGDQVLVEVSRALQNRARKADMVCRWGGEEFAVLAPETDADQALTFAQGILEAIRRQSIDQVGTITASIGFGELGPGETRPEFVSRVDKALYIAKASGRDQVVMTQAPE